MTPEIEKKIEQLRFAKFDTIKSKLSGFIDQAVSDAMQKLVERFKTRIKECETQLNAYDDLSEVSKNVINGRISAFREAKSEVSKYIIKKSK